MVRDSSKIDVRPVFRTPASPPAIAVAQEIMRWLFESNEIAPGERLPSERELALAFRVGRSAVREALKSLSMLGLVEIRQGSGTYFTNRSSSLLPKVLEWGLLLEENRIEELLETRLVIEVALAELAAKRRTEAELQELRARLQAMREAHEPDRWVDADIAFHLSVAHAAHNAVLADFLDRLSDLLRAWIRRSIDLTPTSSAETARRLRHHVAILKAIEKQDSHRAATAMRRSVEQGLAIRLIRQARAGAV